MQAALVNLAEQLSLALGQLLSSSGQAQGLSGTHLRQQMDAIQRKKETLQCLEPFFDARRLNCLQAEAVMMQKGVTSAQLC